MDQCDGQTRSWWIGLSDKKVEGKWVSEMSGKVPEFTKWHAGIFEKNIFNRIYMNCL